MKRKEIKKYYWSDMLLLVYQLEVEYQAACIGDLGLSRQMLYFWLYCIPYSHVFREVILSHIHL